MLRRSMCGGTEPTGIAVGGIGYVRMATNCGAGEGKAPNTNIQAPEKLQLVKANPKFRGHSVYFAFFRLFSVFMGARGVGNHGCGTQGSEVEIGRRSTASYRLISLGTAWRRKFFCGSVARSLRRQTKAAEGAKEGRPASVCKDMQAYARVFEIFFLQGGGRRKACGCG